MHESVETCPVSLATTVLTNAIRRFYIHCHRKYSAKLNAREDQTLLRKKTPGPRISIRVTLLEPHPRI